MGFKTFAAGETLTAADVNAYLMKQTVIVCTSGTRPSAPNTGMTIYETDTQRMLAYDGSAWNLPKNVAGGVLGLAQVTTGQGSITSETDLTGLSVAVSVGASRRVRIRGRVIGQHSAASEYVVLRIKEGATQLQAHPVPWAQAATEEGMEVSVTVSPSAGSHTYKLTAQRTTGSGTFQINAGATFPAELVVEDVGGA